MLELFMLSDCPYCRKVIEYMDSHSITYKKINIKNQEKEEELIKIGGKHQVPFLLDREKHIEIYESSDILEYLKTL